MLSIPMESSMLYINILDYLGFSIGSAPGSHIWLGSKRSPYGIFQLSTLYTKGCCMHPDLLCPAWVSLGQVVKSLK